MPPEAPKFSCSLETSELEGYLCQGIPVVVTDIEIQGEYGPSYFQERFAEKPVVLENCETGQQKRSTVSKFFETFGKPLLRDSKGIWKLKVCVLSYVFMPANRFNSVCQDWPPQKDFCTEFPALFELFKYLVAPHVAHHNGVLNYVAHFPENGIMPDVGKFFFSFLYLHFLLFYHHTYLDARAKDVQRRSDLAR